MLLCYSLTLRNPGHCPRLCRRWPPGSHPVSTTRFPLSRFSPGAGLLRNPSFYTINSKIFQGLGPKRRESSNGDRVHAELLNGRKTVTTYVRKLSQSGYRVKFYDFRQTCFSENPQQKLRQLLANTFTVSKQPVSRSSRGLSQRSSHGLGRKTPFKISEQNVGEISGNCMIRKGLSAKIAVPRACLHARASAAATAPPPGAGVPLTGVIASSPSRLRAERCY